jgi:anti-sigma factor (TIGR02949 family)
MNRNFTNWMGSLFRKPEKKATCCECVKSLQLVVDGEATKEQEQYFMSHLDECLPCYNFYEVEKSVKMILQNKIEKKPCPPHLLDNIREKLSKPM